MENPAPESAILKGKWQALKVPPGSTLDRGMWKEKRIDDCSSMGSALNSGGPFPLPSGNRRDISSRRQGDTDERIRESDPPVVVRDGNAGHTAKERAGKQRKHSTHHGTRLLPTTVSSSLLAKGTGFWHFVSALVPCARFPEEPGAVIPHAGICELTITHKFGLFQSRESRAACLNISTLISTSCSVIFRIRW